MSLYNIKYVRIQKNAIFLADPIVLNGHTVQSVNTLESFESVRWYLGLRYNRVQGLSSNMKYKDCSQQKSLTSL